MQPSNTVHGSTTIVFHLCLNCKVLQYMGEHTVRLVYTLNLKCGHFLYTQSPAWYFVNLLYNTILNHPKKQENRYFLYLFIVLIFIVLNHIVLSLRSQVIHEGKLNKIVSCQTVGVFNEHKSLVHFCYIYRLYMAAFKVYVSHVSVAPFAINK